MAPPPAVQLFKCVKVPVVAYMQFSGDSDKPRILHLDDMTLEDAQKIDSSSYRIQDIVASLIFQRAGKDGLSSFFSEPTGPNSQIRSWQFPAGAFKLVLIHYGLPSRRVSTTILLSQSY